MGKRRGNREAEIQIQAVAYAKETYPILQTLGFYVNNNSPSIFQGVRNRKLGTTAGVFDFICLVRSGAYSALAIDFKVPGNELSLVQRKFQKVAEKQGVKCCVCYSFEQATALIDEYMGGIGDN